MIDDCFSTSYNSFSVFRSAVYKYISLQTHGQSKATTTSIVPANSIVQKSAMPTTTDVEKILA
jgi:hypothetical protein